MTILESRPALTFARPGLAAIAALALWMWTGPALALSEIPKEETPAETPITPVPLPPPISNPGNAQRPAAPADPAAPAAKPEEQAQPEEPVVIPDIERDFTKLPAPVRAFREKLLEAARSGEIEKLRPFITTGDGGTQLSLAGIEGDPVAYLKGLSGDDEGHEILAILEEVLEAGYVHLSPGTPEEVYAWPYFFAVPLDKLTPPQRVELFRLVTAGDYEDMKNYGAYIFYRVGITPKGTWAFFVAGD